MLADLAIDGRSEVDLAPFRIDRPILTQEHPVTSWMV
jgi:hypothetical protein